MLGRTRLSQIGAVALLAICIFGFQNFSRAPGKKGKTAKIQTAAAATPLYYVDFQGARGASFPRKYDYSVESVQGLANRGRSKPILFVLDGEFDNHWLTLAEKELGYQAVRIATPEEFFGKEELFAGSAFGAFPKSMVIFDPDNQAQVAENVAVTVAGIDNRVIVPKSLRGQFEAWGYTVGTDLTQFDWPKRIMDRNGEGGNTQGNIDALTWAKNNYLSRASKKFAAFSPGGFKRTKGIDFMIENKLFLSILDAKPMYVPGTQSLQQRILDEYQPGDLGVGMWSDEGDDIGYLSDRGIFRIGGSPNMSAFTKLRPPDSPPLKQELGGVARRVEAGKSYIFFTYTQGDALNFCNKDNFRNLTSDETKDFPFSLVHTPLQVLFQPLVMWDLHRRTGNKHSFAGKPCGYADVAKLDSTPGLLDKYLNCGRYLTSGEPTYLQQSGIRDIMLNDRELENNEPVVGRIINGLPVRPRSIWIKQDLEGRDRAESKQRMVNGVPVFHDPVTLDLIGNDLDVKSSAARIKESAKFRRFFYVFLSHPIQPPELRALYDKIQKYENIEVLSFNDFVETYKKACPNGGC